MSAQRTVARCVARCVARRAVRCAARPAVRCVALCAVLSPARPAVAQDLARIPARALAHPAAAAQDMVRVPAGTFTMGSARGDADERPERQVRLAAYSIDRHEATQAQYERCVRAGACRAPKQYVGSVGAMLPVVGVTWHDAVRYCAWAGKRLPSEAEWERAARGQDARTYPWGAQLSCAKANFGSFLGDGPCAGPNPGRILPVGSRPAGVSPVGAQDMAGNVWEWVHDAYALHPAADRPDTDRVAATTPDRSDGPGPADRARRVVRGGSCCSYFAMPTTTNRLAFPPDYADSDVGLRCAR